jgi:hypothetical protein
MNAPARRPDNGHFLPGVSGNPTGRPKGAGAIRDLARQYLPAALAKIGALIENPDPRVALAASQEIVNRVFGKPVQSVAAEVTKIDATKLYLEAVRRANGLPPSPNFIPTPEDEPVMVDVSPLPDEPAAVEDNSTIEW